MSKDINGRIAEPGQLIRVYSDFYTTFMDEDILKAQRLDKGYVLYLVNWDGGFEIIGNLRPLQSPTTADASVLKAAWNMAITVANNECMRMSDDWNNDDDIEKADAANECAKRIRGHLDHPHPDLVAQYSTQSLPEPQESKGGEEDKTDMGVYENYLQETTIAQSPSSIEESGLKEGEERQFTFHEMAKCYDNGWNSCLLQEDHWQGKKMFFWDNFKIDITKKP